MPCSTCGHTLARLTGVPGHAFFLCPRCGTVSEQAVDEDANQLPGFPKVYVPKLVERCRAFGMTFSGVCALHAHLWKSLGIPEAIHPPEDRPS